MSLVQLYFRTFFLLSLIFINVLTSILPQDAYNVEKRQIGVLARTGALPQGKRSVEILARNGELPYLGSKKNLNTEDMQDLLIEELERAESLSKLRAQTLAEKIFEERELERFGTHKRSVSALARNGELPQKRSSETLARSGYLIRPSQESVQSSLDLLDQEDFLEGCGTQISSLSIYKFSDSCLNTPTSVDGQSSTMPDEALDERNFKSFISAPKRSLGSAGDFLSDSGTNSYEKKNLASLARDGGLTSLKQPTMKVRKMDGIVEWADTHGEEKKNADWFSKREISGHCWDKYETPDKGNNKRRRSEQFATGDSDYEDIFPGPNQEGKAIEKRFLGRIPQLGRIHQKSQAPSSRRRPHLRPNWL